MTEADLQEAVERARAGDAHAFSDLYRAWSGPLLAYLTSRVRRREDAEDVLGQVFLEAIRGVGRFDGDADGFRAWLYRIARDRAIDAGRRADRRPEEPLESAQDAPAPETPESEALQRLERERVWAAVRQLPEAQREVIVLRLASGLSSSEIAAVIGKQLNAVKALQHRALAGLARLLEDESPHLGPLTAPPHPKSAQERLRSDMRDEQTIDPTELEASEQALTAAFAGDASADPVALRIVAALQTEVRPAVARAHLESIKREASAPAATVDIVPPDSVSPAGRRGRRRAFVAVLAAVMTLGLGSGSALAAAQGAAPGDTLYGLKRASESIRLAIERAPEGKAALHLTFAARRLSEMQRLLRDGKNPLALEDDFESSLTSAEEQALKAERKGADVDELLAKIEANIQKHVVRLNLILAAAPEQAHKGLERAIENAEKAQERVHDAREGGKGNKGNKPDEPGSNGNGNGGGASNRPTSTPGQSSGKPRPAGKR